MYLAHFFVNYLWGNRIALIKQDTLLEASSLCETMEAFLALRFLTSVLNWRLKSDNNLITSWGMTWL